MSSYPNRVSKMILRGGGARPEFWKGEGGGLNG